MKQLLDLVVRPVRWLIAEYKFRRKLKELRRQDPFTY
jgi:hypothetical protein